jgi:hypothetical protein
VQPTYSNALYEILDAWGLSEPEANLNSLAMRDWKRIALAIEQLETPASALGSIHFGLTEGLRLAEGQSAINSLATHAIACDTVWLPDPIASILSHEATEGWALLPEAKGTFFGAKRGGIQLHWKSFWNVPQDQRKRTLMEKLPPILDRLNLLRPLVNVGAVQFFPWERLLLRNAPQMKPVAERLAQDKTVAQLSQRLPQIDYNLGARQGPIGLTVKEGWTGNPEMIPPPGAGLHLVDKMPVVLNALLNATVSASMAASYAPQLPGDRLIYDYALTGLPEPKPRSVVEPLVLPAFGEAVLPDLVAIRRDSEAMALFREAISDAAGVDEQSALDSIRDRLTAAARAAQNESSLGKAVGTRSMQFMLSTFGTALANYAFGGTPLVSAGAGAVGFLASILQNVLSPDRSKKVQRAELITRVSSRL